MAAGRPSQLQVPFSSPLFVNTGLLSVPWQNFFREVRDNLETKREAITSSEFSLGTADYATGEYAEMTNNSVNLSPGTWMLTGQIIAGWSASPPTWTQVFGVWATANGDKSTSPPALVTPDAGGNTMSASVGSVIPTFAAMTMCRVLISEPTLIFLVPGVFFSGAGDGFLKTVIWAERLSKSVARSTP